MIITTGGMVVLLFVGYFGINGIISSLKKLVGDDEDDKKQDK